MHFHVHLIPHFKSSELEQRGIEDDTLRVADFGDGLHHHKTLYYAPFAVKTASPPKLPFRRSKTPSTPFVPGVRPLLGIVFVHLVAQSFLLSAAPPALVRPNLTEQRSCIQAYRP